MKFSTTKLIGLLALLVAVYFTIDFIGGGQKSKSLRSVLVELDTTQVTQLVITGPGKDVEVTKVNGNWQVKLDNGKTVAADKDAVNNALEALNSIKPARLATRKKEKWSEYLVDTAGTVVKAMAGNEVLTEIVLGRLGVAGQRSYHTFVRLVEDDEVYVAKDFMPFNVPSETSSYRPSVVAQLKKDSLVNIEFTYPADSSFRLEKVEGVWMVDGQEADSASVVKYLRGLSYINSKKFMDEEENLTSPTYSASYASADGSTVAIDGYVYDGQLVFNSSENEASYFADSAVFNKAFIGASQLRP